MELAVKSLILGIDKFESVRTIAVHMTISIGCATVAEQEHHLVSGFWTQSDEIPEHVGIL
jgi:hypothetical protein